MSEADPNVQSVAATIIRQRRAAQLDKYRKGTASRNDIAELYGDPEFSAYMPPRDGAEDLPTEPPPEPFALVPPAASVPRRRPGDYALPLVEYAALYNKSVRTIKSYKSTGYAAVPPDPPPLDNPESMPEWWARNMSQKCPDELIEAARVAVAARPAATADPVAPRMPDIPFEIGELTTQDQNLEHLKEQLRRARNELLSAQNEVPADPHKIDSRERKWRELRTEVEEAEAALFKLRKSQGGLVDRAAVIAELLPLLVTVSNAVRSLRTRIRPRLALAKDDTEAEAIWQEGIDSSFAELIAGGFVAREALILNAA